MSRLAPDTLFPTSSRIASPDMILHSALWHGLDQAVEVHRTWIEQRQIELTEIPSPTFHEAARAEYIAEQFRTLGMKNVRLDKAGNVLADRPGAVTAAILLAAHLDTVFPAGTPVQVRRADGRLLAPGITDNGAGLSALLGVAAVLQSSAVSTGLTIQFVANVGEEGEGDLRGMKHLLATAEARRRATAVIILDGAFVDHITRAGLGSRRFLIEVSGPGGHSWNDFGRVNPIHVLAAVIARIERISLPSEPRTTINVGVVEGGVAINSIPQMAWLKVDVRSTDSFLIDRVTLELEQAVRAGIEQEQKRARGHLEARILKVGERPAAELPEGSPLLRVVRETDALLGIQSRLDCSSTDANWPLSLGIEAVSMGGGGKGGNTHTLEEWYDPQGRTLGLKRILLATLAMAGVPEPAEQAG